MRKNKQRRRGEVEMSKQGSCIEVEAGRKDAERLRRQGMK